MKAPAAVLRPAAVALLAVLAFAGSFPGAFILDDLAIVRDNPLVDSPDAVEIFRTDYWGPGASSGLFRPLTVLSYAVNRRLLGPGPAGFHIVNVALHAGVAALVFTVLAAAGIPAGPAFGAGAVFAVHPIHTETVNIVTGRAEILAAFFVLTALLTALRRGRWHRPLAALAFAAALLSKESAATFLPILVAVDLFGCRRARVVIRERLPLYALLAVVVAVWLAWRRWGIPTAALPWNAIDPVDNPIVGLGPAGRLLTLLKVQALYLTRLAAPLRLNAIFVDTMIGPVKSPLAGRAVVLLGSAVFALAITVFGWRRRAPWALGAAFYAAAFIVTANVLFLTPFLVAERFAYLPAAGFCLVLAGGVASVTGRIGRRPSMRAAAAVLATVVVLFGVRTHIRSRDFRSPRALWSAEVEREPGNVRAWILLGGSAWEEGDLAAAGAALATASRLRPDFVETGLAEGFFFLRTARPEEALRPFGRALESVRGASPLALVGLAEALLDLGRVPEARGILEQVPSHFRGTEAFDRLSARISAAGRP